MQAFSTSHALGELTGAAKTGVIELAETALNGHGRAFVHKMKPIAENGGTITVSIGTRDDGTESVSWTSPVTLHPRNKEAHFRADAYFHRARVTMTGGFESATGVHYFHEAAGET